MAVPINSTPQNGKRKLSWAQMAATPRLQRHIPTSTTTQAGSSSPFLRHLVVPLQSGGQDADASVLFADLTLNQAVETVKTVEAVETSDNAVDSEEISPSASIGIPDSSWEPASSIESLWSTPANEENEELSVCVAPIPYELYKACSNLKMLRELDQRNITYISIDIETWFYIDKKTGQHPVLEVGATWWDGGSSGYQKIKSQSYHWIMRESKHLHNNPVFKNGEYNHKYEFFGNGKASKFCSIHDIGDELMFWIKDSAAQGKVVIVLHGGKSDIDNLVKLKCDISHLPIIDTQLVDQALYWEKYHTCQNPQSLANTLYDVGFTPDPKIPFHNAGNDAFFTIVAFARLKAKANAKVRTEVAD